MTKKGIQGRDSRNEAVADAAERAEQLALKDRALAAAAEGIVIADARRPEMPLISVNSGFERITGYAADSVLGKNCRLLQGMGTDPAAAAEIRRAIAEKRECLVEILNYRKDGAATIQSATTSPCWEWNTAARPDICEPGRCEIAAETAGMDFGPSSPSAGSGRIVPGDGRPQTGPAPWRDPRRVCRVLPRPECDDSARQGCVAYYGLLQRLSDTATALMIQLFSMGGFFVSVFWA
jgi:PAS domain S-box-containing protein